MPRECETEEFATALRVKCEERLVGVCTWLPLHGMYSLNKGHVMEINWRMESVQITYVRSCAFTACGRPPVWLAVCLITST